MSDDRTEHGQPTDAPDPTEPTPEATPPAWPSAPDPYITGPDQPTGPPQWPAPPPVEPQAGPSGVHPLDVGRAFSVGWSIFRFRWKALLGVTLLIMVPAYLIQTGLSVYAADAVDRWVAAVQELVFSLERGETLDLADLPPFPFGALLASFASIFLLSIAGIVAGGALIHIIGWTYGGSRATAGGALRQAAARLPSLLGAGLLIGLVTFLIVFGGVVLMAAMFAAVGSQAGPLALLGLIVFVATVVAVIFLAIRWQFYSQAIMLEGAGAMDSIRRSWQLVSGSGWRVLGYLLLLFVVLFVVGLLASFVAIALFGLGVDMRTGQPLPYDPIRVTGQTLITGLVTLLVAPFYTSVLTLLYYDLRWRQREQIGPPPA